MAHNGDAALWASARNGFPIAETLGVNFPLLHPYSTKAEWYMSMANATTSKSIFEPMPGKVSQDFSWMTIGFRLETKKVVETIKVAFESWV